MKWLQSLKLIWGVLLSICLAFQFFSGYPQIILYEFLAIGLMVLTFESHFLQNNFWTFCKKIFGLALFITLGVGLASLQNLPAFELLSYSSRSVETINNAWAFFPWQAVITFLAPAVICCFNPASSVNLPVDSVGRRRADIQAVYICPRLKPERKQ